MASGGAKQQGYVFADGGILAKQRKNGSNERVMWEHTNPATGVIWYTDGTGTLLGREELDPLGADVGLVNPYGLGGGGGGGDCEGSQFQSPRPAANDVDGSCYLNGMAAPCAMVMSMLNHGAANLVDLSKTDEWGRAEKAPIKTAGTVEIGGNLGKYKGLFKNPMQKELSRRLSSDSSTASTDDGEDEKDPESTNNRNARTFSVNVTAPATITFDPSDAPRISTDFRGWSQDRLDRIKLSLGAAKKRLNQNCLDGLKAAGVDPTKLMDAFNKVEAKLSATTNTSGFNIYNPNTSTHPGVVKALTTDKVQNSSAFVLRSETNIYLMDSFFQGMAGKIPIDISEGLVLIHELIHVAGYSDEDFGGSANLSTKVVKACWHSTMGHNNLAMVGL